MAKWGLAGFLAGLLVGAAAFLVLERRRAPAVEAAAVRLSNAEKAAAAAGETAADAQEKLARLEAERDGLRRENRALEASLEKALERLDGPAGGGPPKRRSLKDVAADLARWNDRLRGKTWDTWPKEAKALQAELQELMSALAAELGISPEEAMRSPKGLSALLIELLGQSVPPLTAAQEQQLRDLLAGQLPAWEEWMKSRGEMTALEARRRFLDLAGADRKAFLASLSEEQRAIISGYGLLDQQIQGSQTWFDGTKAAVTKAVAADWTATLSLTEQQQAAVAPIVEEYVLKSRELNDSIWNRRYAGEELSREEDYALRLDLMIETQKKIAESARLTDEQMQAMKEWQFTYGVNITDGQQEKK